MRVLAAAALVALGALLGRPAGAESSAHGVPPGIIIGELAKLHAPVPFDHAGHAAIAGGCRSCHHKKFGDPLSCAGCHSEMAEIKNFVHEQHEPLMDCVACHQVESMDAIRCSLCHKTPFDPERLHVIGLKGALHQQCMGCHQKLGLDVSCVTCHKGP